MKEKSYRGTKEEWPDYSITSRYLTIPSHQGHNVDLKNLIFTLNMVPRLARSIEPYLLRWAWSQPCSIAKSQRPLCVLKTVQRSHDQCHCRWWSLRSATLWLWSSYQGATADSLSWLSGGWKLTSVLRPGTRKHINGPLRTQRNKCLIHTCTRHGRALNCTLNIRLPSPFEEKPTKIVKK